jgi:hypothetical protein
MPAMIHKALGNVTVAADRFRGRLEFSPSSALAGRQMSIARAQLEGLSTSSPEHHSPSEWGAGPSAPICAAAVRSTGAPRHELRPEELTPKRALRGNGAAFERLC